MIINGEKTVSTHFEGRGALYERARETWTNHIQQLNLNYDQKARELREKLMATYRENREKAEQQRQEGGAQ